MYVSSLLRIIHIGYSEVTNGPYNPHQHFADPSLLFKIVPIKLFKVVIVWVNLPFELQSVSEFKHHENFYEFNYKDCQSIRSQQDGN